MCSRIEIHKRLIVDTTMSHMCCTWYTTSLVGAAVQQFSETRNPRKHPWSANNALVSSVTSLFGLQLVVIYCSMCVSGIDALARRCQSTLSQCLDIASLRPGIIVVRQYFVKQGASRACKGAIGQSPSRAGSHELCLVCP